MSFPYRRTRGKEGDASTKKYGNKPVTYDGIDFQSTKEGNRYLYLRALEQKGEIRNLECHTVFELIPKITHEEVIHLKTKDKVVTRTDQPPTTWECDFKYEKADGTTVIEDVKGSKKMITQEWQLKQKLIYWRFGWRAVVVTSPTQAI